MCAIAGGFSYGNGGTRIDMSVVSRLTWSQRRRGPDGASVWSARDGRLALGHRRLAIVDLSASAGQPMSDATGRWTVTLNGEIYNYKTLRAELEGRGHVFRSTSDTEVLINVIAAWGEAGLPKLRGMFAFALWDALKQELWLARDPFGIKPLYAAERDGVMWFASSARALAGCAPVDTRRDSAALAGFYIWGHVPEPFCWWAGIRMFPPGHVQRIRYGHADAPRQFASLMACYAEDARPVDPDELRELVETSVKLHVNADVPTGVFLSGGVDSKVIATLAARQRADIRTVTLAFRDYEGLSLDEAPSAEAAAKQLQTEHLTARLGREEFSALIGDFFDCMDQPSIDGLNTYLVSRAAAHSGLKVALSGIGGDELFAGYPSFRRIPHLSRLTGLWHKVPLLAQIFRLGSRLLVPFGVSPKLAGLPWHARDVASLYLLCRALHLEEDLDALIDEKRLAEGLERLSTASAIARSVDTQGRSDTTVQAKISAMECIWYMRNQLLRDADWAGMAHGVEIRVPYLDFPLFKRIAAAFGSPNPPGKKDLAACAEPFLHIRAERRKVGFTTPVRSWITPEPGHQAANLRGWAAEVHRRFRLLPNVGGASFSKPQAMPVDGLQC